MDQPKFIETIKVLNGRVYNIQRHSMRCLSTRQTFYSDQKLINLRKEIHVPIKYKSGLVKCRITYDKRILNVEFEPYSIKPFSSLKLVEADHLIYAHKFKDRSGIRRLYNNRGSADDILMTRDGFITDTSYANVALWDGHHWYTPSQPLLSGTQRSLLLDDKKLVIRSIHVKNLPSYNQICMFNAMIPLGKATASTDNIRQ